MLGGLPAVPQIGLEVATWIMKLSGSRLMQGGNKPGDYY